ncbi:MAG: hypothetical protein GY797_41410 [Deltaproteobacteria bacterium]|nr:hypothetical protein [Deltaproteobacteria bacterium]
MMLAQVLFLLMLYILGVLVGLLFKKHLPFPFISLTGFLWGAIVWVLIALGCLSLSISYSLLSMSLLVAAVFVVLVAVHIKQGTWRHNRSEISWLVGTMLGLTVVVSAATQFNFSAATYDSISQILLGRTIAYEGFTESTTRSLASWGVFLPLLQSASVFLGEGYLYALQPAFAFTFLLTFFYIGHRAGRQSFFGARVALVLALLTTLTLASTLFIVFQTFYIHNNFPAAIYLFVAVSTFWLALREQNNTWLIFAMLALTCFSLLRTETLLFALIFLSLVIATGQLSYRVRLYIVMPYVGILLIWYVKLLLAIGPGTDILDPKRTLAIIAILIGFGVGVGLSRLRWVENYILPILPMLMIGGLLCALVFVFVQKPTHMHTSLGNIWQNMIFYGWWGATWLIVFILLLFAFLQPKIPYEHLFSYGIAAFFMLLLALSFMRSPYRLVWWDSANRIITHIIPIVFFYLLLKYGHGLSAGNTNVDFIKNRRRAILAMAGVGVLLVVISYSVSP